MAATAVGILRRVVGPGGTGFRAAIGRPLAGKTGTTSSFADAWFTGFTPGWPPRCGSATPAPRSRCVTCLAAARSTAAPSPALIFHDYMAAVLQGQPQ